MEAGPGDVALNRRHRVKPSARQGQVRTRSVVGLGRAAVHPGDGRESNQAARTPLDERLKYGPADVKGAIQVGADDFSPRQVVHEHHGLVADDAGGSDHRVKANAALAEVGQLLCLAFGRAAR